MQRPQPLAAQVLVAEAARASSTQNSSSTDGEIAGLAVTPTQSETASLAASLADESTAESSETAPSSKKRSRQASDPASTTEGEPSLKTAKTTRDDNANKRSTAAESKASTTPSAFDKLKKILHRSDLHGMSFVEWDAMITALWALASSSGASTGPHQDAAGYLTYATCELGGKLWCYLEPKDDSRDIKPAMTALCKFIESCKDTDQIQEHARLVSLVLQPGTIL